MIVENYRNVRLLSFDLELFDNLPEDENGNVKEFDHSQLKISTAAFTEDGENIEYFYDIPYMKRDTAKRLVNIVYERMRNGVFGLTWNGTSFDWRVLGHQADEIEKCAEIALASIDMMLQIVFRKGYYLGLDKVLVGAGLDSKVHSVRLNDGTIITDMSGKKAPEMWKAGEVDAVNTYLKGDVVQPLLLARDIQRRNVINWIGNGGRDMSCYAELTQTMFMYDMPEIPKKQLSWMSFTPPSRESYIEWMPKNIVDKYIVWNKKEIGKD